VSSTNVILFEKATLVFVDVDPLTGNLNVVGTGTSSGCTGKRR
jgi:dTDP-4-amino-4,6-dideoxygalactose transaminase